MWEQFRNTISNLILKTMVLNGLSIEYEGKYDAKMANEEAVNRLKQLMKQEL